jgi:hypothetical protein
MFSISGQWKKIIQQDCAGCWSVYKAHFPVHIWICAGGCNALDGPKDKKDVELFFPSGLKTFSKYFSTEQNEPDMVNKFHWSL